MATKAKKATTTPAAAAPISPFKVKSASNSKSSGSPHVTPSDASIKDAVDEFKKIKAEIKNLEGQLAGTSAVLSTFGRAQFAERHMNGQASGTGNFIIDGHTDTVSFQYQNAGSGLADEDFQAFATAHGEKAAQELLRLDLGSIKLNSDTISKPGVMDMVVNALQSLPPEILENLFTAASYVVTDDVFVKARGHAKSAEDYAAIMADLKVKNFLKA